MLLNLASNSARENLNFYSHSWVTELMIREPYCSLKHTLFKLAKPLTCDTTVKGVTKQEWCLDASEALQSREQQLYTCCYTVKPRRIQTCKATERRDSNLQTGSWPVCMLNRLWFGTSTSWSPVPGSSRWDRGVNVLLQSLNAKFENEKDPYFVKATIKKKIIKRWLLSLLTDLNSLCMSHQ